MTDVRLEGATGDYRFGLASADLTVSHGIAGPYSASLMMSAGTSVGTVPVQHLYYIGGSTTVRGQSIGANLGNAYWFGRAEVGKGLAGRRVLFADFGWAGDREQLSTIYRPIAGAGFGLSFMDGLFRFDVARGIWPEKDWKFTLYMDAKY